MADRLTWWDVEAAARFGTPVRHESWPSGQFLVFRAGSGTTRSVAVIQNGSVETVLSSDNFGAEQFNSDGWQLA